MTRPAAQPGPRAQGRPASGGIARRMGLAQRVRLFTTLGLAAVWAGAVMMMTAVMWEEQEELFDQQMTDTAYVLLPILSGPQPAEGAAQLPPRDNVPGPDEALVYRLIDREGRILHQSGALQGSDIDRAAADGFATSATHRFYTTPLDASGRAVRIAAPLAERREAFRESIMGFIVPMVAFLPLTWFLVGWTTRRGLRPLTALKDEIAGRGASRLDPIDPRDWPDELVQIAGTLNGFMARLHQVLESERSFATNAAHELRTPVAIALAQVQNLRDAAQTPDDAARLHGLERALQRMRRLVARLLQLARADSGIGASRDAHDVAALARLVVADSVPRAQAHRIALAEPQSPVCARIDPDAFAIILSNLIDNALQHAPPDTPVQIAIRPGTAPEVGALPGASLGAVIDVTNGGPAVSDLDDLPRRYVTRRRVPDSRPAREGFGLGLHICTQIAEQTGGRLALISPAPGRKDGFLARVHLPG